MRKWFLSLSLGVVIIGVGGYFLIDHAMKEMVEKTAPKLADLEVPLKGSMGEVLFGTHADTKVIQTNKTGLDVLFDHPEQAPNSPGILEAYKRDPDKFKRYAEMFDTATRAKQLVQHLQSQKLNTPVESTSILNVPLNLTKDAWNNPYCVVETASKVVVVSGMVRGKARVCNVIAKDSLYLNAKRSVFESDQGEVVVIVSKDKKPS